MELTCSDTTTSTTITRTTTTTTTNLSRTSEVVQDTIGGGVVGGQ